MRMWLGRPYPLGATWDGNGVNFALFSEHAEKVEICSFDERDSAKFAPLGIVIDTAFTWGDDRPPRTPWHETIIYEAHVKGFTKLNEAGPAALRGTYAGFASEAAIAHLKTLGVT